MIIKEEYNGAVCKNPQPYGCKEAIKKQIKYVEGKGKFNGAKKALIIGASSGYGLATRISIGFGAEADTIGVSFEVGTSEKRPTATAGWWNNIWFKELAESKGRIAKNFVGDAFSNDMKKSVIDYIKEEFGGKVDLVVYSLASGRRTDPIDGKTYMSALKSIDGEVVASTIDITTKQIVDGKMEKATQEDIYNTVKVMGGEDWKLWIEFLSEAGVLAEGCKTTAYSYEGPKAMYPIYEGGTIGAAKRDLEKTAIEINGFLNDKVEGEAFVSVCKALVTKASAFIPLFPIYCSILYKVMKANGTHEDCIAQIERLLVDMVYGNKRNVDSKERVRADNLEMIPEVQAKVEKIMDSITSKTLMSESDFKGFLQEFSQLNGFGFDKVNYDEDIDLDEISSLNY